MQFRRFGSGCELAREYCVALCVHSFKEVKWRLLESRFGVSGCEVLDGAQALDRSCGSLGPERLMSISL